MQISIKNLSPKSKNININEDPRQYHKYHTMPSNAATGPALEAFAFPSGSTGTTAAGWPGSGGPRHVGKFGGSGTSRD